MGEIVNLRQQRKSRARQVAAQDAAENRVRHGRTGAQKRADAAAAKRDAARHQGAKLGPEKAETP